MRIRPPARCALNTAGRASLGFSPIAVAVALDAVTEIVAARSAHVLPTAACSTNTRTRPPASCALSTAGGAILGFCPVAVAVALDTIVRMVATCRSHILARSTVLTVLLVAGVISPRFTVNAVRLRSVPCPAGISACAAADAVARAVAACGADVLARSTVDTRSGALRVFVPAARAQLARTIRVGFLPTGAVKLSSISSSSSPFSVRTRRPPTWAQLPGVSYGGGGGGGT